METLLYIQHLVSTVPDCIKIPWLVLLMTGGFADIAAQAWRAR